MVERLGGNTINTTLFKRGWAVNLITDQAYWKVMHIHIIWFPNLITCCNVVYVPIVRFTCRVTCWLCLSANSHHLNALGSSIVDCHLPDPLRSWFHHRGGRTGWQETLTADRSEPPTVRWVQSREEPSRCSAKRHRQELVVTMCSLDFLKIVAG